jgi:chromate reductase, NAD(P)H dehydrogenase (quinone)
MQVLGVSGSLRQASINSAMLRAAARLAPSPMRLTVCAGLGALPLFNPDETDQPGEAVRHWFAAVEQADALVFASPEYAHGLTGTIKNALDWLVGFEPFAGKPVAVVNTSARAMHADAALREVLSTMAAQIVGPASVTLPLLAAHLDEDGMVASPVVSTRIVALLRALQVGIEPPADPLFSHPLASDFP